MNRKVNETPNEKFKRLASARTQKIIDTLKLLGNCSNTYHYEYSSEEVKRIFEAIETELKITKDRFQQSVRTDKRFKL